MVSVTTVATTMEVSAEIMVTDIRTALIMVSETLASVIVRKTRCLNLNKVGITDLLTQVLEVIMASVLVAEVAEALAVDLQEVLAAVAASDLEEEDNTTAFSNITDIV